MSPADYLQSITPPDWKPKHGDLPYDLKSWVAGHRDEEGKPIFAYQYVWRAVTGRRISRPPSLALLMAFYEDSAGEVGIPDWVELYSQPPEDRVPKKPRRPRLGRKAPRRRKR